MRLSLAVLWCALALPGMADEGLWLFNQFPKSAVQEKYKLEVTDAFLENLRLASVEIAGGGGAFVSPGGLLLTNQHLLSACVPAEGFYAPAPESETPCRGIEARVLVSLQDV